MSNNLRFLNTTAGCKVFDGKKHIKTIPARYESVFDKVMISTDRKRLLPWERFCFEWELFKYDLEVTDKYVLELISDASVVKTYFVNVHDGSTRYEAELSNGRKIKIDANLYNAFTDKDDKPHFSNW